MEHPHAAASESPRDHTLRIYSARSSPQSPTGHVYFSTVDDQGEEQFFHFGPQNGLDPQDPGSKKAAASGTPGAVSDFALYEYDACQEVPITREQHEQLHAYVRSQTRNGELTGESRGDYRVGADLPGGNKDDNNCVSFTFNAAEHAKVEEARQYRSLTPNGVANKLDNGPNPSQEESSLLSESERAAAQRPSHEPRRDGPGLASGEEPAAARERPRTK